MKLGIRKFKDQSKIEYRGASINMFRRKIVHSFPSPLNNYMFIFEVRLPCFFWHKEIKNCLVLKMTH